MTDTVTRDAAASPPAAKRSYAKLAADESREDYSLRYAPHSFRRWSPVTVAGTALGVGITLLAGQAFPDGLTISPVALLLAAAFAVAIGLTAGVYPALRASRLAPVDALRAL